MALCGGPRRVALLVLLLLAVAALFVLQPATGDAEDGR